MEKLRNSLNAPVLEFQWDGESFVPLPRFAKLCDRDFVIGERYRMEVIEERSQASHAHYFAAIRESWLNLPENLADRFPTPEHLRKFALIRAGYRSERSIVCDTEADAKRCASFAQPIDEYAVVIPKGTVVTIYTAKSQSHRSMGKEDFQASKDAVLTELARILDVKPATLQREAGKAA